MQITPHVSVGKLAFGQTRADIAARLGAPDRVEGAADRVPTDAAMADLARQFPELAEHLPAAQQALGDVAAASAGETVESRLDADGLPRHPTLTFADDALVEIAWEPPLGPLTLDGLDIAAPDRLAVLRALGDRGVEMRADADLLLLPAAGVAMAPLAEAGERPQIVVFARGRFAAELDSLPRWTP